MDFALRLEARLNFPIAGETVEYGYIFSRIALGAIPMFWTHTTSWADHTHMLCTIISHPRGSVPTAFCTPIDLLAPYVAIIQKDQLPHFEQCIQSTHVEIDGLVFAYLNAKLSEVEKSYAIYIGDNYHFSQAKYVKANSCKLFGAGN